MSVKMSSPTCISCQNPLSCNDSGLSVTGNIFGILTFATTLLMTIGIYNNLFKNARSRSQDLAMNLASLAAEFNNLHRRFEGVESEIDNELFRRLEFAMNQVNEPLNYANVLFSKFDMDCGYTKRSRYFAGVKYIMAEDRIMEAMNKVEKKMNTLREVKSDVLAQ